MLKPLSKMSLGLILLNGTQTLPESHYLKLVPHFILPEVGYMEFIKEFRGWPQRILCNIILEKLVGWSFKRFDTGIRRILALGLLFLLFEIIELLALLIIQEPIAPVFIASLIAALVASLSIYVVSWCYQYTLEQAEAAISISPLGKTVEKQSVDWLRKTVNPWTQLLTSVVAIILVVLAVYLIEDKVGLPFNCSVATFVALGLVTFGMSQGGHWAIVTPLMTRKLRRGDVSEIGVYPLYPSKTPILVAVSKVLSVFAIWDAVMVTLCLIGLFALRPDFSRGGILYLLALVLAGYLVTSWQFLYPQFNLAQVVQRAKEDTLLRIQRESKRLYEELGKLENADFERLKHLMELHETVSRGPQHSNQLLWTTIILWFFDSADYSSNSWRIEVGEHTGEVDLNSSVGFKTWKKVVASGPTPDRVTHKRSTVLNIPFWEHERSSSLILN